MDLVVVGAVGAVVVIGAVVQGTVGFGLGLFAVPLLAMLAPDLLPGPLIFAGASLALLLLIRDRSEFDLYGVRWALVGRIAGNVGGAALVATLPGPALSIFFASAVLVAVGLSVSGWRVPANRASLVTAGTASGVMGTATAIGGPPIALVYQDSSGVRLRGSLSGFFVVGSFISIGTLAAFGEMGGTEFLAGLALLPPTLLGFFVSRRITRFVDRGHLRTSVWVTSALSSVVVIIRELWP